MLIVVQIWAAVLLLECQVSLTVYYLKMLCLSNQIFPQIDIPGDIEELHKRLTIIKHKINSIPMYGFLLFF